MTMALIIVYLMIGMVFVGLALLGAEKMRKEHPEEAKEFDKYYLFIMFESLILWPYFAYRIWQSEHNK